MNWWSCENGHHLCSAQKERSAFRVNVWKFWRVKGMSTNGPDRQNSQPQDGFIDLERTFRVLEGPQLDERASIDARRKAAAQAYLESTGGMHTSLSWTQLLESPLTVVLGEPGSGKTWELREQARRMRDRGVNGFFLPLENLIQSQLPDVLSPQDQQLYHAWLIGRGRATFFVDSVDEAKFQKAADFSRALEHLRHAIGDFGATRVQLILSSRISEWSPATDANQVSSSFPLLITPPTKEAKALRLRVVQLDPLGPSQVNTFAKMKGISESDVFVQAIEDSFAWDFARRPYDVVGLINFWQREHRIGTPGEIVEQMILEELRETQDKRSQDPLSPEKARQGAESLAAADILCRELNICIPDDAHISDAPGLDSSKVLPSAWTSREHTSLLARALFDSACYGRIRFHHRRMV
jgi:hypothetical protein